jgi:hypothetical protein
MVKWGLASQNTTRRRWGRAHGSQFSYAEITMVRRPLSVLVGLSALLAWCTLSAVACTVDSSKYTFDDAKFAEAASGGRAPAGGSASGGADGQAGSASTGGDANLGGSTTGGTGPVCTERDLRCTDKQIEICTGTEWLGVGDPCEFVCKDNACTGLCEPGTSECVNELEQRVCNADGQWDTEACPNACIGTSCGGNCAPGTFACGTPNAGKTPVKVCVGGEWDATTTICDKGCTDGACTGGCTALARQCGFMLDGTPAVLTCPGDGADWKDATKTPCTDQACVDGACGGECQPGAKDCHNLTRRVCSTLGKWETEDCPFLCKPDQCEGECAPGSSGCVGDNITKCDENGRWNVAEKCGERGQTCVNLGADKVACGDCNPAPGVAYCNFTKVVECTADAVWKEVEDCATQGYLCGGGECFKDRYCPENPDTSGCLDRTKGWICSKPREPATMCECDCAAGNDCASLCKY